MDQRQLEKAKAQKSHRIMTSSSSQEKLFIPAKKPCSIPSPIYKAQSTKQMEADMMMMLMMKKKITSQETSSNNTSHQPNIIIPSSTTITSPIWKLYENPFYISDNHNQLKNLQQESADDHKQIHRLNLPVSARKIANSFWDLTFIKSLMDSELETARAQINELKKEIEIERKARKKMESLSKRLARELSEEKKGRETLERVCQELAKEVSSDKDEINSMKEEMQNERKMMRVAEVLREERVQMKLAEAKIVMEEKFLEMEKKMGLIESSSSSSNVKKKEAKNIIDEKIVEMNTCKQSTFSFGEKLRFILGEKSISTGNVNSSSSMGSHIENPHIKRGIKGFVEFPKVVKEIGCRSSSKHYLNTKLECQKAQLKLLLKHKGTVRFNGLIAR